MKRYFMIFLAAVAAVVSCHKEPAQEPNHEPTHEPQVVETHEVTIDAGILSKTALEGNAVMWEGSDEIALVFTHTSSAPHVNRTFVNQEAEKTTERALFKGQIPNNVSEADGYNDLGYAVYPKTAITDGGIFSHNLSSVQVAKENGSFPSGCNLSSAALALSDMGEGGSTKTDFRNALSILRIALSEDVESVTVTGTAPLAGTAPLQMYYNSEDAEDADNGRLLVDAKGKWSDASTSVTLTPANGTVFENKTYNVLVWPGKQEGLTITLQFKNLGEYEKASSISASKHVTFKPARYYNLNVSNTEELVVTEITGKLDDLENSLPDLDELEGNVEGLLNQIQSISLMSEYLDNAVYARYAQMTYSKQKLDLSLDYIVKPVAAAEALVEAFNQHPAVVSGLLGYDKGDGFELVSNPLTVKALSLDDVQGIGIMTATVDASNIDNKFYEGTWDASIALQISNGKSDMISDFANLVPTAGNSISGTNLISVVPGASVVIPFNYSVSGADYTLAVTESQGVASTSCSYDNNSKTGYLTVSFKDETVVEPSVTLTLTVGKGESQEVVEYDYTFFDNGVRIVLLTSGDVDWIGGDVTIEDKSNITGGTLVQIGGTGVAFDNIATFTFDENSGPQRTATVRFSVMTNSMTYYKDITLTQKAYGSQLSTTYYANGQKVVLNGADAGCSNYFNIVILGDGYKKKDLAVGGKFEKSARSAMETFFAIEPYKTYMNRFNVYMVAYESDEEGTDIRSSGVNKNTYFNSYCQGGGNTAAYVSDGGEDKVIAAVKNAVGKEDAKYYRSIAILLINTAEGAGSTGYPFRGYKANWPNGYASFAIAVLAANSDRTNGLIKHEAGGHAFGRLADEYYTGGTVTSDKVTELQDWHDKGFYWNVTDSSTGYYKFAWPGYPDVGFFEGAWNYAHGLYRPTERGMMQNNNGVFNAPSRHAIYHRIITESGDLYVPMYFPEYDKINLNN